MSSVPLRPVNVAGGCAITNLKLLGVAYFFLRSCFETFMTFKAIRSVPLTS